MFFKKHLRKFLYFVLVLFILMNVVAFFHAYKFTHFSDGDTAKTKDPKQLTFTEKLSTLFFGVNNPRPANKGLPRFSYETIKLQSNKLIECWYIKNDVSKGTIILFHGYGGEKSSMLDKAKIFKQLGYNCFLVDFMGCGGSEGNQTTIGFAEAEQVKSCVEFIQQKGEKNIVLFGTSLGAAAIMKAMNDYQLSVKCLILECPFGSMLRTVQNRFTTMHAPSFPMANLLVFWGGVQNGFNAFSHNPEEYAKKINWPVLLMRGGKDEKVSQEETEAIYNNLAGKKELCIFPEAGHENYLNKYKNEWCDRIAKFFNSTTEVNRVSIKNEKNSFKENIDFLTDSLIKGKRALIDTYIRKYQNDSCGLFTYKNEDLGSEFNGLKNIGDINGDKINDTVFVMPPFNYCDAGDSYYFFDSTIPRLYTDSYCCNPNNIFKTDDIDEDGIVEIGIYYSSCVSRYKSLRIYKLKNNSWVEIATSVFDIGTQDPSEIQYETLVKKTRKNEFEMCNFEDGNTFWEKKTIE